MIKTVFDVMSGKKTYISLLVLTITMFSGINVSEQDIQLVLSQSEMIISAVSIITAAVSRYVAKPKV